MGFPLDALDALVEHLCLHQVLAGEAVVGLGGGDVLEELAPGVSQPQLLGPLYRLVREQVVADALEQLADHWRRSSSADNQASAWRRVTT
jgi:hypothetical protein